MSYKLLTAALILFLVTGIGPDVRAQASEDSAFLRRLADVILTDGKAYEDLRVLTKTVGPRLSGSAGYYKAEAWGQKAFQAANADKVWLQECMVPHWVRGGRDSASFEVPSGAGTVSRASGRHGLDILALGNSVGTGPKGITAPVVLIHSFEELQQRKDEVKGKIVFYNYPFNPTFVETFRSYGDAVRYRVFGPSQAAKYGALAVLVRSMSHSVDNNPHTGALVYNDSFPKIPAAAVGLQDADKLAAAIGHGGEVRVFLRTPAHMLADTAAHNVIGEIRGSLSPEEYITVGGHLDSWDPAEGAMDDGTGCVQSIEVLRAFKAMGYTPKHTIRAVLFANEENGGRGGDKYMEEAKAKGERHLFALESDAGGFTPRSFSMGVSDTQLAAIQPWLKLLRPYGVYEFAKGGGGADVDPMQKLGVAVGELRPDSQRYFDYHHSRKDVLEVVNKREMELGAFNMAALIYLVDKYGWEGGL
ncbi:M20/M25/M40 family metallo-hydrolase [Flavitalea sp. BT771]|uniref:M20/M25/M40 family metallo-hydrolase n=1 Tax=Flavitalea sp. BT771 TaxID=3063329 RepID=UPI0026E2DAC3|nr:M20/M25/M40 family metallo-hydrolase [Flavitalea sp. BT771]MDO6432948.1 M20/M25/M40 family metallo-hydrolase [Flavitalea sp. BT771]MDV6221776.1 M20/M25/M40 family metallo-hydrolase [Flavitalea sp. BT771]